MDQPATYDVVCIGFGTKGLALSTVLADHDPSQKVLVVERDGQFNGDLGFASTESSAGSSFLRDLITLRNPRSEYTFINFLHETNLLIAFTNASQLITSRHLTARYMTWVAEKIQRLGWVAFNKEAVNIKPTKISADGQVSKWTVDLRANGNGAASKITCRRLIVATGAQSRLPESLASPKLTSNVLPMSKSAELIKRVHEANRPLNIAIVGADQESVELFEHLIAAPGQHRATMIIAGSALRVEDGTPFTHEMVDGANNSSLHHLPPEVRQRMLATTVAAEFPTVDLHTLEALYISLYSQQVQQPDKSQHRFTMRPHTRISHASLEPSSGKVQLTANDVRSHANTQIPESYDLVIATTEREALPGKPLLAPLSRMFDSGNGSWTVDTGYKVNFRRNMLAPGCGIWVVGTLADPNVRRDNFAILSASAGRALDSILEVAQAEQKEEGGALSASDLAHMKADTLKAMRKNKPTEQTIYIKAIDTDLPLDKQIVSTAKWQIYPRQRTDAELDKDAEEGGREDMFSEGANVDAMKAFFGELVEKRRERFGGEPYVLLSVLVVHPEHQRRGLGAKQLQWGLEKADEMGVQAYLESSPKGKGLYAKFGFVAEGGMKFDARTWGKEEDVPHTYMVRPAKGKQ